MFNKKSIFIHAHNLRKSGMSLSDALRSAWNCAKAEGIYNRLLSGIVKFAYRNAEGEIRKATGTLQSNLIQYSGKGSSERQTITPNGVLKYWDMDRAAFRSFRIDRIVNA